MLAPKQPTYQGKTLTYWLKQAQIQNIRFFAPLVDMQNLDSEPARAIREIGTNAIPILLKFAAAHDGTVKTKFIGLVNGQKLIPLHVNSANEKRSYALTGFVCLRSTATAAYPQLIKLLHNSDSNVCRLADVCLLNINKRYPVASETAMAQCMHSSDAQLSRFAGEFIHRNFQLDAAPLGVYHLFPDLTPPPILRVTNNPPAK